MEDVQTLIVGAGVTGLATAAFLPAGSNVLVVEAEAEPGGYCRTVVQDGFVWDYSGHFFHFKNPQLEAWLVQRMGGQKVLRVDKRALIRFADRYVDFPFQKNIHQLPQQDFIGCLHDLYTAHRAGNPAAPNFKQMLINRLGNGICTRFLFPYNEKLYATDLANLDPDAMGRFFPHADFDAVMANMKAADNRSYNDTFTYPEGGAVQYVHALLSQVDPARVRLRERLLSVDLDGHTATTTSGTYHYERLVSSMPLPALLKACGLPHDASVFSWNKVLVFNLGFDAPGNINAHWVYYPQQDLRFYRVGFYNNIFGTDRLSLYVEVGLSADAPVDVEAERTRVLADLGAAGVTTKDHRLLSWHHVVLDPAYVHITGPGQKEVARVQQALRARGVYSAGRYGAWTYCSIEDNMLEAQALAARFSGTAQT